MFTFLKHIPLPHIDGRYLPDDHPGKDTMSRTWSAHRCLTGLPTPNPSMYSSAKVTQHNQRLQASFMQPSVGHCHPQRITCHSSRRIPTCVPKSFQAEWNDVLFFPTACIRVLVLPRRNICQAVLTFRSVLIQMTTRMARNAALASSYGASGR